MTEPERPRSPAIASIGDQLATAWKAQEAKKRRGRHTLVVAVTIVTLAIPGALAASDFFVGTPGPHRDTSRNGPAVVLATGSTATESWTLTTFHRRATICFGLRTIVKARVFYSDDCDPGFPAAHAVTFGTLSVAGWTFVYGATTTTNAARVRTTVGGKTIEAPLLDPRPGSSRSASAPARLRVFVVPVADGAGPPTVVVVSDDGRIVGRA